MTTERFTSFKNPSLRMLGLCLTLAATSMPVTAFDLDSSQPIQVESDSARLDDQTGTATYTGNVRVTQGEARMEADKVVLRRSNGELRSIQAHGKPATYRQPETEQDPKLYAEGHRIVYSAGDSLITFERKALIRQAGDSFSGHLIRYEIDKRVVTAESAEDDRTDRVRMTIEPGQGRKNDDSN